MSLAADLRRLHTDPEILVVVNVWDVASARTVAAAPGCRAIATASYAIAATRGLPDGETISRDAMLEAVGAIARAVDLPVTADLEAGYGDAAETARLAWEAGVVGCNLEDGVPGGLRDEHEAAERVGAMREAAPDLVINARTDVFLAGDRDVDHALRRGRAYLEAGADCVFVPGVREPATIRALVDGLGGPVSVLAGKGSPSVAELQELGVARVSFGPGPMGLALAALQRAATDLLAGGAPPADLAFRP